MLLTDKETLEMAGLDDKVANNQARYRQLCEAEPSIPLFSRAWWLDAVAGPGNWRVAMVLKDDAVIAAMPYVLQRRLGFTLIKQAPLTPSLGPWLAPSTAKYAKLLANEKDSMEALVAQLPKFDHFQQKWSALRSNWLPFYWMGFRQTTRYTYVIGDLSDEARLWSDFQANVRGDIRKAEARFHLRVRDDPTIDAFLELNRKTFARQGRTLPYSEAFVRTLDATCLAKSSRKIWIAHDDEGRDHAGVYIVWDENSAYYLMGGGNPELRNSGATSLCMWEAIRHAASVTKRFDFEGSMIEPVERFFRGFGAVQTQYFQISKTPSWLIRIHLAMLDILRGDGQ